MVTRLTDSFGGRMYWIIAPFGTLLLSEEEARELFGELGSELAQDTPDKAEDDGA